MAFVQEATVSQERIVSHQAYGGQPYESTKVFVCLKAQLVEGDELRPIVKRLQSEAEHLVDQQADVVIATVKAEASGKPKQPPQGGARRW